MHNEYIKNVPEKFKNKYKELTKNNNINLVDLQNIQISDSCFAYVEASLEGSVQNFFEQLLFKKALLGVVVLLSKCHF